MPGAQARVLAGVQVGNDIHEARLRCEFLSAGFDVEREVRICEPGARHGFVAADHRVQRAEEPDEQDGELERLRVGDRPYRLFFIRETVASLTPRMGGERGLRYVEFVLRRAERRW